MYSHPTCVLFFRKHIPEASLLLILDEAVPSIAPGLIANPHPSFIFFIKLLSFPPLLPSICEPDTGGPW
jgi:hypothetical protein